jgi:hypothetical protein
VLVQCDDVFLLLEAVLSDALRGLGVCVFKVLLEGRLFVECALERCDARVGGREGRLELADGGLRLGWGLDACRWEVLVSFTVARQR